MNQDGFGGAYGYTQIGDDSYQNSNYNTPFNQASYSDHYQGAYTSPSGYHG